MSLIDADIFMNELNESQQEFDEYYKGLGKAKTLLLSQPTVDAVEVVHGRWVEQDKYTFGTMYDCSICDNRILDNGHSWNYCPNCGAKMDEKENNNDK